jgi:RNA polymerase sigma factor (sigma-70 family)
MPSPSLTLLRTQSDDRLVALAREGHERAFEAIVERYRKSLLRAARRVLPEGRAEDALQQGLLKAWTALQRGDEVRELRPWLYRIVHHTALNTLRGGGYDYAELHEAVQIADGSDEELERRALMRQTLASLAALPERQREALLRTAVSGDPQGEVARDLGVSDNALRQLVHRARRSLRAAATAITPLPLVTAAAAGSSRDGGLVERIAELVAVGGGSATLAKAGAVAVLAGGAVSGPAIVDRVAEPPAKPEAVAAAPKRERPRPASTPAPTPRPAAPARVAVAVATAAPKRRAVRRKAARERSADRDDRRGHRREARRERDDHAGHRRGSRRARDGDAGRGRRGRDDDEGARRQRGDSGHGRRGRDRDRDDHEADDHGHAGSGHVDDDSGGSGNGGDDTEREPEVATPVPTPLATVTPTATPSVEPDDGLGGSSAN